MIDYYQIITPIFAIFTAVSLLLLKKSLQDTAALIKLRQKKHQSASTSQNPQQKQQKSLKNSIKYMLSNFTILQICCIGRAKSKVPFIFSLSIIGILSLFLPQPFIFSWVGSLSYLLLILCSIFSYGKTSIDTHEQQSRLNRQKNVSIIFTILTVVANMVIIGKCFRNYKNDSLAQFISFFAINAVLDNMVVRPIFLIISTIPLHQAQSFHLLIKETTRDLVLLETYDAVGQKQIFQKPGKMYSPSKFNKRIPLQIQPVGYNTQENNQENQNPLEILKRIKKQKIIPPASLTTPLRDLNDNRQCSMNSFFNSHKQSNDSPLANIDFNNPFSTQKQNDGPNQLLMKKKMLSQHMVMINPSNNQQNNQDFQEEITVSNPVNSDITQTQGQENNKKLLSKTIDDHPLRISMNSSSNPSARQQPLKICIGGQMRVLQGTFQDQQQNQQNTDQDQAFQSNKDSNRNNAFCTLEIKEKEQLNEIQQVDLNSPQRRRRGEQVSVVEQSRFDVIKKKKKKKMSHDERNNPRVIKFTTGQPYLQYLPDMLSKDKNKKSHSNSRNVLPMQSRFTNSTKRPKKGKTDNIQNMAPTSFRVEDI